VPLECFLRHVKENTKSPHKARSEPSSREQVDQKPQAAFVKRRFSKKFLIPTDTGHSPSRKGSLPLPDQEKPNHMTKHNYRRLTRKTTLETW
jgi:hypothetical protein